MIREMIYQLRQRRRSRCIRERLSPYSYGPMQSGGPMTDEEIDEHRLRRPARGLSARDAGVHASGLFPGAGARVLRPVRAPARGHGPVMARRRPVPSEWREDHHRLTTRSHAWGTGFRRVSRTKGTCSCGARWPSSPNTDNLTYADVVDLYRDHVEAAYYDGEAPLT